MNIKEIDETILASKLFLNQNSPPREQYSFGDATLAKAKHFLKANADLKEPETYWVDNAGNLQKVPKGMWFDVKADCLRFKK